MNVVRFCERTKISVSVAQVVQHFIDWTDIRRLTRVEAEPKYSLHLQMAKEIMEYAEEDHSGKITLG